MAALTHSSIPKAATGLRFTSKELDEDTELYYFGARYLDPKASRWISGDPALGEYMPTAPIKDEAKKQNGNLPGMGGVFNPVNMHLYHYAGNNPLKYVDPDGRDFWNTEVPVQFTTVSGTVTAPGFSMELAFGFYALPKEGLNISERALFQDAFTMPGLCLTTRGASPIFNNGLSTNPAATLGLISSLIILDQFSQEAGLIIDVGAAIGTSLGNKWNLDSLSATLNMGQFDSIENMKGAYQTVGGSGTLVDLTIGGDAILDIKTLELHALSISVGAGINAPGEVRYRPGYTFLIPFDELGELLQ